MKPSAAAESLFMTKSSNKNSKDHKKDKTFLELDEQESTSSKEKLTIEVQDDEKKLEQKKQELKQLEEKNTQLDKSIADLENKSDSKDLDKISKI